MEEDKLRDLLGGLNFRTTQEIQVPSKIIDQVIGQDHAVEIIKKAAIQKRHVLLIGPPGTGKSMLAKAMAELLPVEELEDIIVLHNPQDANTPKIKIVPAGEGRRIVERARDQAQASMRMRASVIMLSALLIVLAAIYYSFTHGPLILFAGIIAAGFLLLISRQAIPQEKAMIPKLLVDNSGRSTAPFVDATGAHAGALLGDVRHDPYQSFHPDTVIYEVIGDRIKPILISEFVDELLAQYPELVEDHPQLEDYKGLVLPEPRYILGMSQGKLSPVKVHVVNRRIYQGELVKLRFEDHTLILTPEHEIYSDQGLIEASKFDSNRLIKYEIPILSESDILETFSADQRNSALEYYKYLDFKQSHPEYGYKRISKLLGIPISKLRWWHTHGSKPDPVKTLEWLKHRGLVPLAPTHELAPIIARILGALFGDGGIFNNLNGIFFSSKELSSIQRFKQDLVKIFGKELERQIHIKSGSGIKSSTFRICCTNRCVVRYFLALGAPRGRKSLIPLKIPAWIYINDRLKLEFFGALFGSELSSPGLHNRGNFVNSFEFGIGGKSQLEPNRISFLNQVARFLSEYGLQTTSIYTHEYRPDRSLWRLLISKKLDNIARFNAHIPIIYSLRKQLRIKNVLNRLGWRLPGSQIKIESYLKPKSRLEFSGYVYNVTTESGNLIANGLLVKNSGGLETPSHERVEPGAIHRAHKGVLYIDEINTLKLESQQQLLTAMQEGKFPITGQSERSAGALVRTEPVPCQFILVAAGNMDALQGMHPALRSRIRGYGYEVYMNDCMPDTPQNRAKLVRFVAQEVVKDGKIPHFTSEAVAEIIREARRRSPKRNSLSLVLRDLGGLIRAAGDLARSEGAEYVQPEHVMRAKSLSRTIEQQFVDQYLERKREYEFYKIRGAEIGRVNGLAVMGNSGIVLPILAEVTPALSRSGGRLIATGRLQEIAREAVENVSAIIKKITGEDISSKDIHIQFLGTHEGVEGDSASISIATAIISALTKIPVDQSLGMTGSLSVRGDVLPVGGVTFKVEAAAKAGLSKVLIPKSNLQDLNLESQYSGIQIVPVTHISEVLKQSLVADGDSLKEIISRLS